MNALPPGKFPNQLLKGLLSSLPADDSVIVGPGVGRDAATVRLGDEILVLKTDPITFATDEIGWYLVNINANDIACMGAEPRWLLVTSLLPEEGTTTELVETIFADLQRACERVGCSLVGGHTEITEGLDRPILVGNMIGVAQERDLIDPMTARPGDDVLLIGGIAVEGTTILANEFHDRLAGAVDSFELTRASEFLYRPGISVVPYARALRRIDNLAIRALHDPTEGGLATGLDELAEATGLGIRVTEEDVAFYPETLRLCGALGVDPWGLIASGALLAIVEPGQVPVIQRELEPLGVPVARIGTMTDRVDERTLYSDGKAGRIPSFAVDEVARLFSENG